MTSRTYETRRVVVLAGSHLTRETSEHLTRTPLADWPVAGGVLPYGFYIYAHDEDTDGNIPADLWACLYWASGQGFDYVQFDCDAEPLDCLPVHDWGDDAPAPTDYDSVVGRASKASGWS